MDLNHIAGELVTKINCTYSNEAAAKLVVAALESVQAETERRTLERAIRRCEECRDRDIEHRRKARDGSYWSWAIDAHEEDAAAIRALIDKPVPPEPVTADDGYPPEPDEYTLGHVIWHTSEEGGGPDVGISIGTGSGKSLWIGEITSARHKNGGEAVAALGDDSGWWLMIYPDCMPIAKFADTYVAREFSEQIEGLAHKAAAVIKPAPPDPLLAALARGDPNRLDLESVPSGWRFDQLCVLEGGTWEVVLERTGTAPYDADHPERRRIAEGPTPRSALRAAIALAEGAR